MQNNSLRIPYGLAVHDKEEEVSVLKVLREKRTIMGRETREFESKIAKLYSKKYGVAVNSGSSANLLAFEILDLPKDSEVITPILTFATTVTPIIQKGLIPVFIDVEEGKYIIDTSQIERAITKKTRALMIPLLLGNVPDMKKLQQLAKKYRLYLIEDSCDTLGATFDGKPTGYYSDISTTSFYGSHIITAGGNGGMIMINKGEWADRLRVLRGWGRSSSLFSESEDISKRFTIKLGGIPYDAKFIFDEMGYNLLPSELGSAFGLAQLKKIDGFRRIRENNFKELLNFFAKYERYFTLPVQSPRVKTQWLAFPLVIKNGAPFSRMEIVKYLEQNNIQTRPIFTGNILKQPAFKKNRSKKLKNSSIVTDSVMRNGFVIGCHHGLEKKHIDKLKNTFAAFLSNYFI